MDFGGGGWILDRSQNATIQFGNLWPDRPSQHADDGGINGSGNYTVNVAGGTLKAGDDGMTYFLGNAFRTTIGAGYHP